MSELVIQLDKARLDDPASAVALAEELIPSVELVDLPDVMGLYGLALRRLGRVDEAEYAILKGLKLARARGDHAARARQLQRLSFAVSSKGDFERAVGLAAESFALNVLLDDQPSVGRVLVDLASFFEKTLRQDLCLRALQEASKLIAEDDSNNRYSVILAMGYSYLALEELEKATMHVEKAKAYEDAVGQPLVASRFRLEGRIQSRLENLESARQNLEQAGVIYLDLKNYFEAAYTTIELIEVLKAAGKYEEARSYLKTPEIHDFH